MNFKEELNEEQYAAVTAPDGAALVVAAAGTGKTRTLIYRLAYLVTEKQVQPFEVLLLTFTNKAAREMLSRAEELVNQRFNSGYSGTFHSFANKLLRSHAHELKGLNFGRDFSILDADDAKKLMRSCIDELGVEKKHFPKPEVLLSLFGVVSGRMGDLTAAIDEQFEHSDVDADQVVKAHNLYQERKQLANAMDFDDLLIFAHKLLAENERARFFYQESFKYVLVDEYQDTNAIQAALVNLLVQTHGNIMVVGDDFQSIYSWRGADFRNFLDFEKFYPGAATYKLQINYRSTPEILEVANEVIAGNKDQFQKELQAVRAGGAMPHLAKVRDGSVQARFVIEKAREINRRGIPLSEICVLYRSHFHAMELQMELARSQMSYVVTSGVRFFEQAHVKDVLTVLQLLVNPSNGIAFFRLVEMLPKVGEKTAQKIFKKLGGRVNLQRPEIHDELIAALPAAAREDWEKIKPVFLAYREEHLENDPGELIFRFGKAFYKEYMVENFDNHKFRQEDLDGLIDFTVKFDSTESFLSEVALLTNLDADSGKAPSEEEQRDSLRLSTVHQAKGLEWKAVFVLFVNEEMFPSKKAIEENGDAEERRLFYVAVTRAEDELFLCSPMVRRQRDGGMIFLDPSRFLAEIPEDLLSNEAGFY
ncbi:ATP-dependent helicase [Pontiella sp.]|uniref:ATP-dependent helicase n=1 Tax=Pontiella sp. TaxID=2837462 RepID=UPI00356502A8